MSFSVQVIPPDTPGTVHARAYPPDHITKDVAQHVLDKLRDHISCVDLARRADDVANIREDIFEEIVAERMRQNLKFTGSGTGEQHHNVITWAAVLGEESGEVTEAALDLIFKGEDDTSLERAVRMIHLRDELIQTAAVAVQIIERIDAVDVSLVEPEKGRSRKHDNV